METPTCAMGGSSQVISFLQPNCAASIHCSTASPPANADLVLMDFRRSGAGDSGQMCSPEQAVKQGGKLIFFATLGIQLSRTSAGAAQGSAVIPSAYSGEKLALACAEVRGQ